MFVSKTRNRLIVFSIVLTCLLILVSIKNDHLVPKDLQTSSSEDNKQKNSNKGTVQEEHTEITFYEMLPKQTFIISPQFSDYYKSKKDNLEYIIITGTFTTLLSAQKHINRLNKHKFNAEIKSYSKNAQNNLFQVRIGPIKGKRKKNLVENQLAGIGVLSVYSIIKK